MYMDFEKYNRDIRILKTVTSEWFVLTCGRIRINMLCDTSEHVFSDTPFGDDNALTKHKERRVSGE